jgi:hypothetical protein
METATFKQFEKKFGKDWVCTCGTSFQIEWLETTSADKSGAIAWYLCQICGREQIFSLKATSQPAKESPTIKIPHQQLTSDDVLEVKKVAAAATFVQIKNLARRSRTAKLPVLRTLR